MLDTSHGKRWVQLSALWLAIGCSDTTTLGPWREPTPLALDLTGIDDPTLTSDLLELYVNLSGTDIYVAKRASVAEPFGPTTRVVELSSGTAEGAPEVSGDGLSLYMTSMRAGTFDIWLATRTDRTQPWSPPQPVTELNSPGEDFSSAPTDDQLTIVFTSDRNASAEIFLSTRATSDTTWNTPLDLVEVGGTFHDAGPMLSSDGLTLFFDSNRTGTNDLYEARRATVDDSFDPPIAIVELATDQNEDDPWISPDGHTMIFSSDRDGTRRLWQTTR